ncbi:MAG: beta domain [Bacteroidota bacterium]|jgi:hypothetical protein
MRNELNTIEQIERFLNNELNPDERETFKQEMALDQDLQENVIAQKVMQRAIMQLGMREEIANAGKSYQKELKIRITIWVMVGIGMASVIGFSIFKLLQHDSTGIQRVRFENNKLKVSNQLLEKPTFSNLKLDNINNNSTKKISNNESLKEDIAHQEHDYNKFVHSDSLLNKSISEYNAEKPSSNKEHEASAKIQKQEILTSQNAKLIPQKTKRKDESKMDDVLESIGGIFNNWGSIFKSKPKTNKGKIQAATITITNNLSKDVLVFWVDAQGNEMKYKLIRANEGYVQETYLGHVWVLRTSDDSEKVVEFKITKRNQHFDTEGEVSNAKFKETQKNIFWAPVFKEAIKASTITVKNTLQETVAVYWLDYRNMEIQYFKLAANEEKKQATFIDQNWVIRKLSDSTKVLQFTVTKSEEYFEVK